MAEFFVGRQKRRKSAQGELEELGSPEDISLAGERESHFDRQSQRKAREGDAKLSLIERAVWLVVKVIAVGVALFIAVSHPIVPGCIGVGGGVRAVWKALAKGRL